MVGTLIVFGLDLSINRAKDVINKETCILNCLGEKELERLGTMGHPTITPVGHHLFVKRIKL